MMYMKIIKSNLYNSIELFVSKDVLSTTASIIKSDKK